MSLYSSMFYSGQLEHQERAKQVALMPFFQSHGLDVPVLLHHVRGQERQDRGSSSFYNLEELRAVTFYIAGLLRDSALGLSGADIGVISPYTKQISRIQRELLNLGGGAE